MQKTLTLHGVPRGLARDGWWLDAPLDAAPPDPGGPRTPGLATGRLPHGAALLGLVVLADLLFWRHAPGLSLVVFAVAVFGVAQVGGKPGQLLRPVGVLAVASAPVIEHVQALSLFFLALGLPAALIWARHPEGRVDGIASSVLALLRQLPRRCLAPLRPRALPKLALGLRPGQLLRDWGFPLGGTLVFAALLMDANPMLVRLLQVDLDLWSMTRRALFWLGTAVLVAPFVTSDLPLAQMPRLTVPVRLPGLGINARSVLRALVLFNLMIAVQMVTDASILLGGAALPQGMDYAEYAHRGAYPLLATAVLAGAFALAARPFWAEHRLIRPLLLVWLGQNVVLCGAAALRLDLYIGAYGLTYLRIYALIWMALVAAGLGLLGWQLVRARDSRWLLLRAGSVGLVTLYLCSFFNFAEIIAAQIVRQDQPDLRYLCDLGPMASGAVYDTTAGPLRESLDAWYPCSVLQVPQISDWRDWGFRSWRVTHKVQTVTGPAASVPERLE